jgi:hypothetical protein
MKPTMLQQLRKLFLFLLVQAAIGAASKDKKKRR